MPDETFALQPEGIVVEREAFFLEKCPYSLPYGNPYLIRLPRFLAASRTRAQDRYSRILAFCCRLLVPVFRPVTPKGGLLTNVDAPNWWQTLAGAGCGWAWPLIVAAREGTATDADVNDAMAPHFAPAAEAALHACPCPAPQKMTPAWHIAALIGATFCSGSAPVPNLELCCHHPHPHALPGRFCTDGEWGSVGLGRI